MEHPLSFADSEYKNKRRQTRKEKFLERMETLVPWKRMFSVIEPYYPKPGHGRRPYPLMTMLRTHCMQQWYSMSDSAMEEALYDIPAMRLFAGLSLDGTIPDHNHDHELPSLIRAS